MIDLNSMKGTELVAEYNKRVKNKVGAILLTWAGLGSWGQPSTWRCLMSGRTARRRPEWLTTRLKIPKRQPTIQ